MKNGRNAWIFQSNPNKFSIDGYLEHISNSDMSIAYTVRQFKKEISEGDIVYIWRSNAGDKERGGIIAKGIIKSNPTCMEIDDRAWNLWIEKPPCRCLLMVFIEIEEIKKDKNKMLKRKDLLQKLPDLNILKNPRSTNYKLEPNEAKTIETLWERI